MTTILELLPRATVEKLVAAGLLPRRLTKEARAELTSEFARIDRAVARLERQKGRTLTRRELIRLMTSFPGQGPPGTRLKHGRRGGYRQETWDLP